MWVWITLSDKKVEQHRYQHLQTRVISNYNFQTTCFHFNMTPCAFRLSDRRGQTLNSFNEFIQTVFVANLRRDKKRWVAALLSRSLVPGAIRRPSGARTGETRPVRRAPPSGAPVLLTRASHKNLPPRNLQT